MYGLIEKMKAAPGQRDALVAILLSGVSGMPGCLSYVVAQARSRQGGAQTFGEPTTFPYGERQYTAVDPGGHVGTFSQSVADADPSSWGGILVGHAADNQTEEVVPAAQ